MKLQKKNSLIVIYLQLGLYLPPYKYINSKILNKSYAKKNMPKKSTL